MIGKFGDGGLDGSEGTADRGGIAEVQLDAAYIGFVRNGFRVELEHHRIADFARAAHSFGLSFRHNRAHGGDAVEFQNLLRFRFGGERAL